MKRLTLPDIDAGDLLSECASDVTNLVQQEKYLAHQPHFTQAAVDFGAASAIAAWCNLPRVAIGGGDNVIFGNITKRELMNLYSDNMVGSKGDARQRYDEILVVADGKCPFCGGIGHAKTLDHYLPKANFPQYSICPSNLVPCCRDCNTAKNSAFPYLASAQAIHPYFDGLHFFNERWVVAEVLNTNPVAVRFAARPPTTWAEQDRQRAEAHFEDYGLSLRYGVEVGPEISGLIDLRRTTLNESSPQWFQNFLIEHANAAALPLNGWKRTMYASLATTDWFYQAQF